MVKVTHETLECDVCGKPAERYTLAFPDGIKILDRCDQHAKKIMSLKDEPGGWSAIGANSRGRLTVLTPAEINSMREGTGPAKKDGTGSKK